jgi:hypothetical protein
MTYSVPIQEEKMPRKIPEAQRQYAINLMLNGYGQREIERETGLSRPYLRKLASLMGHQFPRNGIEVISDLCMCSNCGMFFRRPASKIKRAKKSFCSDMCRFVHMKGPNHPSWKTGETIKSFSEWVKNQTAYDDWRTAVLERDNNRCVISGRTDNLQAHHIMHKAEGMNPELAFDVQNGMTLNEDVHRRLHSLVSEGYLFEDAVSLLRSEYNKEAVNANAEEE